MKFQRKRNLYVFETREFTMRVCISFRFKLCRSKLPKLYINSLHEFRSRNVNHLYRQNYGNFFYFFFFLFIRFIRNTPMIRRRKFSNFSFVTPLPSPSPLLSSFFLYLLKENTRAFPWYTVKFANFVS